MGDKPLQEIKDYVCLNRAERDLGNKRRRQEEMRREEGIGE